MKIRILLLTTAAFLIFFGACKKETKCVEGNGNIIQEQRTPDSFLNVQLNGAYDVSLYQGQKSQVDIFAESNIISLIQTYVTNNTLVVKVQDDQCYNTNNTVEVSIQNPDFEVVTFNGAGEIKASNLIVDKLTYHLNGSGSIESGLELNDLTLNIAGAGNATFIGNGSMGNFTISGSGSVFATNFVQDSVYITISGTGDVRLYVAKYLNVTITGSGSVYYKGNPEDVVTSITGSGVVEPI